MIEAINKQLIPLGVQLPQTEPDAVGGYFIWLTLPDSMNATAVAERAKEEENLIVAQGESKASPQISPTVPQVLTVPSVRGKKCRPSFFTVLNADMSRFPAIESALISSIIYDFALHGRMRSS
jgi:hypothetical protein